MIKKIIYVLKVLRERGVGFFWTYFRESVWFDLYHGINTSTRVPKEEQTIVSSNKEADNGLLYVASFTSVTRDTVSHARNILGDKKFAVSQFIDLGCGKGKALLVFKKIFGLINKPSAIGIEYDPELTKLAKRNIDKCNFARASVDVFTDSAANLMSYTEADTLIIYLYNSFQGDTLKEVLNVLSNTPHVLIYVDPVEENMLPNYGYEIIHKNEGSYNADTWLVATSGL